MKKRLGKNASPVGDLAPDPLSRRGFIKVAAGTGAAVVLPMGLAACGSDGGSTTAAGTTGGGAAAEGKVTGEIVNQVHTLADEFFKNWGEGFNSAAKALGMKAKSVYPNFDVGREIAQARNVKATGGLGLACIPSGPGQTPVLSRICQADGVKFTPAFDNAAWFTPVDVGDNYVAFLTPETRQGMREVADEVFKTVGGSGEFIHIMGRPGSSTDKWRTLGVDDAIKDYPGMKMVARRPCDWTREAGRSTMLNLLSAYPNVKAVIAQSDAIALGVLSVLEERGLKDVKVGGADGIPEVIPKLKGSNFVASSANIGYYMAGFCAVNIYDALNGWKPRLPERLLYSGAFLVTAKDTPVLEKAYDYKSNPFDWKKMSRTLNPGSWDPQFKITPADPNELWRDFPKDLPLNKAYSEPNFKTELEDVKAEYAERYKTGPLKA